jgi:hypothetical protein
MIKKSLTVGLGAALLASAACSNDSLTDVNKNPNAPETVSPDLLFANGAVSAVRLVRSTIEITPSTFSHWPQYLAEYQYPEISYYQFRPTTADAWWLNFYAGGVSGGALEDFRQALSRATAANRPNQIGPILTMRAFVYSTMTGMWGDIPFTQANQGDEASSRRSMTPSRSSTIRCSRI